MNRFLFFIQTQEEEANSLKDITKKTIWVKNGQTYEQHSVTPGINDGAKTLIQEGLNANDEVVVGIKALVPGDGKKQGGAKSFMPGPPERKKR